MPCRDGSTAVAGEEVKRLEIAQFQGIPGFTAIFGCHPGIPFLTFDNSPDYWDKRGS